MSGSYSHGPHSASRVYGIVREKKNWALRHRLAGSCSASSTIRQKTDVSKCLNISCNLIDLLNPITITKYLCTEFVPAIKQF